jgi:rod shape-determining protein MreC
VALTLARARSGAIVIALLAIPLTLIRSCALGDARDASSFDRAVRRVGAPVEAGAGYAMSVVGSFFERWVFQARMVEERDQLDVENRDLRRQLRQLARLEDENRQLRRSLQMRDQVPEDLLAASVTGTEQSPVFRVVKISLDRGAGYVRRGMAVIAPDGVVGRVERTYDAHSDVKLITDPSSRVAVEVARTHEPGILEGLGEDLCRVRLPSEPPVVEGDVIQTSGADDLFPKAHPIGRVSRVDKRPDAQIVDVIPSVRFDRLDMVWVVLAHAPAPDPDAGAPRAEQPSRGLLPVR